VVDSALIGVETDIILGGLAGGGPAGGGDDSDV